MEIPRRMRRRPTFKGLPIPYIQFVGPDGQPDFKVNDLAKLEDVLRRRLCGLCGVRLDPVVALIGGEKCIKSGIFHDPPMHSECARYAALTCPYLSQPTGRYSKAAPKHLKPEDTVVILEQDAKRPKRMAIYYTKSYEWGVIPGMGPGLFTKVGPATGIDWTIMPESP